MSRRIWKEGANPQRVPRAARREVARKLADADCGRQLALVWRKAKRNTIPLNSSKGQLMKFQVMRLSAAALATSVALAGAASAQTQPAKPAAPAAPGAPGAPGQATADLALQTLRQAIAAGYRDLFSYRGDITLDPLRSRPDFELLLMDLAIPANPFAQ